MLALRLVFAGVAFAARVHITSEVPVALEHRAAPASIWQEVCVAPCDRELPIDGEYRAVFRNGIDPSAPFPLEASAGGAVDLEIEPPSKGKKIAGIAMIGVGAPLAVGGVLGAIALFASSVGQTDGRGGITTGLGAISGLVGLIGTGVLLGGFGVVSGAEAQTTQAPRAREPTWAAPRAEVDRKPAVFVPLSVSF